MSLLEVKGSLTYSVPNPYTKAALDLAQHFIITLTNPFTLTRPLGPNPAHPEEASRAVSKGVFAPSRRIEGGRAAMLFT